MSTKTSNKTSTPASTPAARNAVIAAFCTALSSFESSGSIVTQVCNAASKWYKGDSIGPEDRKSIVEEIARVRGWKADAAKARTSECNAVLKAYVSLPEAIELFTKRNNGSVQWHNSLALARQINKGESIHTAVKNVMTKSGGQSKKSTPSGRVAGALKAWFKDARPDKKQDILKAAALLGIKLGVKLDA